MEKLFLLISTHMVSLTLYYCSECNILKKKIVFQSGDSEIVMEDSSRLIFHYVQQLHHHLAHGDRLKRVWDPTYSLIYRDSDSAAAEPNWSVPYVCRHIGKEKLPKSVLIQYLQKKASVRLLCH